MTSRPSALRDTWLPSAAALLSIFVFAVSASTLPAALLRAAGELEVDPTRLTEVFSAQFFAFVTVTVVAGILADYFGKKVLFLAGSALMVAGAFAWAGANSTPMAYLGGGLLGMGGGIFESLSSAVLSDLFPTRRKLFLNLSQVLYCVGAVGGPALMGWLMPLGVSWRVFFAGIGALGIVLLVLFQLSHIPRPDHEDRIDPARLRAIVRRPAFLIPCVVILFYVLSEAGTALYINYHLRQNLGAPENWAIYGVSAFWLCMGVGRLLCAAIPEHWSNELLIGIACLGGAAAMAAQTWCDTWVVSFAWFGVTGLVFAGAWPMIVGLTATRNPGNSGTVIGVTVATGALGCVVAPWMMNGLFAVVPPGTAFAIAALPLPIAAALLAVLHRIPFAPRDVQRPARSPSGGSVSVNVSSGRKSRNSCSS